MAPLTGTDGTSQGPGGSPWEETDSGDSDSATEGSGQNTTNGACGDGALDGDEDCDDGVENILGNECNPDCTLNLCGDGIRGPSEECDLGTDNGPETSCSESCTITPSSCGKQSSEAELGASAPVDIIFVIDNSGSMSEEIKGVQQNINVNFAEIIEESGLDYRVIMVSRHGSSNANKICVEAPLSGIPKGGCQAPPNKPVFTPGKFYHYSLGISSTDAWCKLVGSFSGAIPDESGLAQGGWKQWLREDAIKTLVVISDDASSCGAFKDASNIQAGQSAAQAFDETLLSLAPEHFGTPDSRTYTFHSIVGMPFNNPKTQAYDIQDPIILGTCPSGQAPGTGHQALSVDTGGLRFPLCDTTSYDAVFQEIAEGVIEGANVSCAFDVPIPPEGQVVDKDSIVVTYTPSGGGTPIVYSRVANSEVCAPKSFYVDEQTVNLCSVECTTVQQDPMAKVEVEFGCLPVKPQ